MRKKCKNMTEPTENEENQHFGKSKSTLGMRPILHF